MERGSNGPSGFMGGVIAGIEPGIEVGNRFAQWRSARAAQKVYDAADAGAYGDDAEGQARLQADLRHANAPISARGGDSSYGQEPYNAYLQTEKLRAAQRAGSAVPDASAPSAGNAGGGAVDYTGGLTQYAKSMRGLGDMKSGIGLDQASGAMAAGRSSINNTGQTSVDGTAPGEVNQAQLASGTAANAANYGDATSAQNWATDASAKGQAAVTGMAGRAISTWNMHLGQIPKDASPQTKTRLMSSAVEAVMPYVQSMAKMNGYGDVQKSSDGKYYVLDGQGNAVAALDADNIGTAISQFGDNPENILPRIQGVAAKNAEQTNKFTMDTREKTRDAMLTNAGKAVAPDVMRMARADATAAQGAAAKMGWKVIGTNPEMGPDGATPTGRKTLLVQPYPGRPPVAITMGSSGDPADQSAFQITDQNGKPLPPEMVAQLSAGAQAYATAQQKADAADQMELNQRQYSQGNANMRDVMNSFLPGQQGGAMGTPAPRSTLPQIGTPADVHNYQSPFPDLGAASRTVESGNNQSAVSPKGAIGVSQLGAATIADGEAQYGLPAGSAKSNQHVNAQLGDMYRDKLVAKYTQATGNAGLGKVMALAAYNWGPNAFDRAIAVDPRQRLDDMAQWLQGTGDAPSWLPDETKKYIPKVGAAMAKAQQSRLPRLTGRSATAMLPKNANPKYLQ